jgi:hypothetical protein
MTATSPMMSKRFGVRCKSGAGIVPLIWSRRFISDYVGFLGDKVCVCGIFCFKRTYYIFSHGPARLRIGGIRKIHGNILNFGFSARFSALKVLL